jgi:hypothetical protein
MKEKNCQSRNLCPVNISFKNVGEIKTFSDNEKFRKSDIHRPSVKKE